MESKPKNREWVKNAAIIFLAVLLVLTFFSNTIMNRSLPEAATQYVQSGAITAKVRGSGTVESQGVYEVKATETREIRAVMIKTGQQVEAGDVLFVLGEGDSAEIEAAQEQLRQLKLSYQQTALGATNYSGQLANAQTRYNNAVAAEAAAYAKLYENSEFTDMLTAIEKQKSILSEAETKYKIDNNMALQSTQKLSAAFAEYILRAETYGASADGLARLNTALISVNNAAELLSAANSDSYAVVSAGAELAAAKGILESFGASDEGNQLIGLHGDLAFDTLLPYFTSAMQYLPANDGSDCQLLIDIQNILKATEKLNSEQNRYEGYSSAFSEDYNAAVAERQAAEAALKALRDSADDYNRQAALTGLSLQDLNYQIKKAEEKLASLSGGTENQIRSNVSGTVSSVAVTAGKTAAKDEVLATIEVPDMGYTLSFSVTADQARRLRPGDSGSVTSYYWGSRIDAVLTAIKPDPKDPQGSKILEFDVTGDVSAGSQLTISVGERSQTYDFVVPNSALRSDSNGKFVYVIQAKNSALGNRYFARRVDVEVIASDDNNSAVTGSLNYGDYVITTASAPLKNGMQVRMAEG